MMVKRKTFVPWAAMVACCWATPVHANSTLDDKGWIELGGYLPKVDSEVQVTSKASNRPGTVIDLETDLDLDDSKTLPQVSAGLRLGKHWVIGADFYSLKRSGERDAQRDIVFDDVTYPAGARLESGFTSTIYRFTVGYSFVRTPNTEVGAALGAHLTDFDFSLQGTAQVDGTVQQSTLRRRKVLAPLPTIGIYGNQRISEDLTLSARVDYLSLKIDQYDGRLINAQAALTWRFTRNFGIGAMYRYVDYRVKVDKDDWSGQLQYKFNGPALFVQVGF